MYGQWFLKYGPQKNIYTTWNCMRNEILSARINGVCEDELLQKAVWVPRLAKGQAWPARDPGLCFRPLETIPGRKASRGTDHDLGRLNRSARGKIWKIFEGNLLYGRPSSSQKTRKPWRKRNVCFFLTWQNTPWQNQKASSSLEKIWNVWQTKPIFLPD